MQLFIFPLIFTFGLTALGAPLFGLCAVVSRSSRRRYIKISAVFSGVLVSSAAALTVMLQPDSGYADVKERIKVGMSEREALTVISGRPVTIRATSLGVEHVSLVSSTFPFADQLSIYMKDGKVSAVYDSD